MVVVTVVAVVVVVSSGSISSSTTTTTTNSFPFWFRIVGPRLPPESGKEYQSRACILRDWGYDTAYCTTLGHKIAI